MDKKKIGIVFIVVGVLGIILLLASVLFLNTKGSPQASSEDISQPTTTEEMTENIYNPATEVIEISDLSESNSLASHVAISEDDFRAFLDKNSDKPKATSEELTEVIVSVRNSYRNYEFAKGSEEIGAFFMDHSFDDSESSREFFILYSDSYSTGNLEAYLNAEEYYDADNIERFIEPIKDPETFLLAVLSFREGYRLYLNKDSLFLNEKVALYTQGKVLGEDDRHFEDALAYGDIDALYEFPIRYNDSHTLYAYVVSMSGRLWVLDIENEDGSFVTPYEWEHGTTEDIFSYRIYVTEEDSSEDMEEVSEEVSTEESEVD